MNKFWYELTPCNECGADSAQVCAPYCTAPENRTGKMYVLNDRGRLMVTALQIVKPAAILAFGLLIVGALILAMFKGWV
jgi:hypothetical protein